MMKLDEYARHDALGLAHLVASGQVSAPCWRSPPRAPWMW